MDRNDNAGRRAPKDGSGGAKRLESGPSLEEDCECCSWWMREIGIEAMLKDDKSAAHSMAADDHQAGDRHHTNNHSDACGNQVKVKEMLARMLQDREGAGKKIAKYEGLIRDLNAKINGNKKYTKSSDVKK